MLAQSRKWLRRFRPYADLLFPRMCQVCDQSLLDPDRESICQDCLDDLKPDENRCQRCSAPVSTAVAQSPKACRLCKKIWWFDRAICLCTYRGKASKAARRMKSAKNEALAFEVGIKLGQWLNETIDLGVYDYLIPIPQHWVRRILVQYNQADVLARAIAASCDVRIRRDVLVRTRWTEKQGTKTIEERLHSITNSFACRYPQLVSGNNLLLVDDIVTSGATASESAKVLKAAGAKRVDIVAVARGASSSSI